MTQKLRFAVLLAGAGFLLTTTVSAGPPAICHPDDIGTARSLPWLAGESWNLPDPNYKLSDLVNDTLALLAPSTPLKLRMETMRRAAIYSAKDERLSYELAARLMARAMNSEASGKLEPMSWFDAGYFVETLKQATLVYRWNMLSPEQKQAWTLRHEVDGIDGLAWVDKAIRLKGDSAEFRAARAKFPTEPAGGQKSARTR